MTQTAYFHRYGAEERTYSMYVWALRSILRKQFKYWPSLMYQEVNERLDT